MERPGVGTFTLMPTPARMLVSFGSVSGPLLIAVDVPAPSWMLSATGIKLPPMTRKPATPPTVVERLSNPFGFQLEIPAVKLIFARPNVARAPKAVPFPASEFGTPTSPLIVTPVPPLGLFHAGIPAHCAARGVTPASPAAAITNRMRFIDILHIVVSSPGHQ